MNKYFNLRVPLLLAVALTAGTALGYAKAYYNFNIVWFTATAFAVAVCLILVFALRGANKRRVVCALFAFFLFFGAFNASFRFDAFTVNGFPENAACEVSGVALSREEAKDGAYVTFGSLRVGGKRVGGRLYAYLGDESGDYCGVGDRAYFTATVQAEDAFAYGKFNTGAAYGVKYYCRVYYGVTVEKTFAPLLAVNAAVRNALYSNTDGDTAGVACAMLLGSTEGVDEGLLNTFRYGGIAHVFAVSGLHIGLVYAAVNFLLKKCRADKTVAAVLCAALVFFYAGVCGFAASSLRAAIMCTTASFCKIAYRKYDGLNAMSLAAVVLLVVQPFWLFTVGFCLSFGAVASIFLFVHTFERLFSFLPRKISSPLSVTLSVQAGTAPLLLGGFGYLSVAGLLLNPVVIPVISLIFVLLFACTLVSVVLPPLAALFIPAAAAPLGFCMSAVNALGLENTVVRLGGSAHLFVFYVALLLLFSLRVNIRIPVRAACAAILCAVIAVSAVVTSFSPLKGVDVYVTAAQNGEAVVLKSGGESVIVVGENSTEAFIRSVVNRYCFRPPDAYILLGEGEEDILNNSAIFQGQLVYIGEDYAVTPTFGGATAVRGDGFSVNGMAFRFTDPCTLTVRIGGVTAGVSVGESALSGCDLVVSENAQEASGGAYCAYFSLKDYQYNIYDCGDLLFSVKNDKIELKSILPVKDYIFP